MQVHMMTHHLASNANVALRRENHCPFGLAEREPSRICGDLGPEKWIVFGKRLPT
jgi:hypothetical protein